jgi:hypothetical protein
MLVSPKQFLTPQASHEHSLKTLNMFYEFDDFMESIGSVADLGCGADALDSIWWATRTTRDDVPEPLNIKVLSVDLFPTIDRSIFSQGDISYYGTNIEQWRETKRPFDLLWCHNTFQYMTNPMQCLSNWWHLANTHSMLVLIVPQATTIEAGQQAFDQYSGCYYNHTLVSLMHMLAVNGWDCGSGFFYKQANDPWLHAAVYKSSREPMDPKKTSWYDLMEAGLLPESANKSILRHGYLRQRDLTLKWLDGTLVWYGQ